jgi:glycosyltransferase involved in cell wall biosynthesis
MRILVCTTQTPLPPLNGLRLQLDALINELRCNHEVRLLGFRKPDQSTDSVKDWMRLLPDPRVGGRRAVLRAAPNRRPIELRELDAALAPVLSEELATFRPDVVHVTPARMAVVGSRLNAVPSVLAALDAWHLNVEAGIRRAWGHRRFLLHDQLRRVKRFEAMEYKRFNRVVVVTPQDREALLEVAPGLQVEVIPNGVHTELYAPQQGVERESNLILFTGTMSWRPNISAAEFIARDVLPVVRDRVMDARLAIVGRNPGPAVLALGSLEGVQVVGEVAEMGPWLSRARAYAAPMISGTGIKNKLLEAMANGLPCVTTPLALQGLEVAHQREVLIAEDGPTLARHLVSILCDDALAARVGAAGREYVSRHHTWRAVAKTYEGVYLDALTEARI